MMEYTEHDFAEELGYELHTVTRAIRSLFERHYMPLKPPDNLADCWEYTALQLELILALLGRMEADCSVFNGDSIEYVTAKYKYFGDFAAEIQKNCYEPR